MPRMTAKYSGALHIAQFRGLDDVTQATQSGKQEDVYQALQKEGFFWNSQNKVWEEHDIADADDPTPLIMVRVWADAEIVEEAADDITRKAKKHWRLVERSRPYPCRPPKQRESRVYLKFLPKGVQ